MSVFPVKEITSNQDAKNAMRQASEVLSEVVGSTMGYRGRTVLIEDNGRLPFPTKDGYNVLREIFLNDPVAHLVCETYKQASSKTVDLAGDGTTLTIVLANAFLKSSLDKLEKGISAIDITKSIEQSVDLIIDELTKIAIPLTEGNLYNVARTSANHDLEIADIVQKAFAHAGEFGSVSYTRSANEETYLESVDGNMYDNGYDEPAFVNVLKTRTVEYANPYILVSNAFIKTYEQIRPFIEFAIGNQRPIIIFADMEKTIENTLASNRVKNGFPFCVVKPIYNGKKRIQYLDDLAVTCGTMVLTEDVAHNTAPIFHQYLGEAQNIVINETDSIVKPLDYNKQKIDSRIEELKTQIETSEFASQKEYLRERISKLSGKISTIKIGAFTEAELQEKQDRVDDAVKAVRSAKEEGVLAGGGVSLAYVAENLKDKIDDVTYKAVQAPLHRILQNASVDLFELEQYPIGYDVREFKKTDMIESGILDCLKVLKNALQNATSVSNTLLMTNHVITYARYESVTR